MKRHIFLLPGLSALSKLTYTTPSTPVGDVDASKGTRESKRRS
jgi:hypothetical protein